MTALPPGIPDGAEVISLGGFNTYIGPFYRLPDGDGMRRYAFVAEPHHMNSAGAVHGGMLMALADVAMSRTSRAAAGDRRCTTVSLNCDFVAPAREGETIVAQVRIHRQTRSMIFLAAELSVGDRFVLAATGIWKILGEDG